jgi:hypothetical protein
VEPGTATAPDPAAVRAWTALAEFGDAVAFSVAGASFGRRDRRPGLAGSVAAASRATATAATPGLPGREPDIQACIADHLRWGERRRPSAARDAHEVLPGTVDRTLAWRTWLTLPGPGAPRVVLVATELPRPPRTRPSADPLRARMVHGIHNGAHLDHLVALSDASLVPASPSPAEFGTGLMAAEAYAMAVELVALAEFAVLGMRRETEVLLKGVAERIGRIPGYRDWFRDHPEAHRSPTLVSAATVRIGEFAGLPVLASAYVTGPLRLLADRGADPFVPPRMHADLRSRWEAAADLLPAARALGARAVSAEPAPRTPGTRPASSPARPVASRNGCASPGRGRVPPPAPTTAPRR